MRVVEAISPVRLGAGFRWLLASSWVTNIGDGVALAAGPLLVASQTHDPLLVAMAALLQRVPWLLFGLHAGVAADRLDRRLIVVTADVLRAGVLLALALVIVTGAVNVGLVLVAVFVLGTAETLADTTTSTLLPMLVAPAELGLGNARLMVGQITANQLAGPSIGAALFALGMAWPFAVQATCMALGAALVSRLPVARPARPETHDTARRQIADGLRWLWHHPPVRTLTITIVVFNVTFGAAWSVLVLYATERLGLGDIGFGLVTTVGAVGGVLGSWCYGWIERRVSLADVMRVGLVIETLTHLSLALTTTPAVALLVFLVFGAHAAVWGTTASSIRQRAVPAAYQGRVGAAYMMGVHGGLVAGSAVGGVVARAWGVTAPFWFAFVGSALILGVIWRELTNIAHADVPSGERPDQRRLPPEVSGGGRGG
jgi:predicted MFS family arabinose efflux permease